MRTEILKYGRIRDIRTDRGLTQEQVAAILHVSQNTYSQYEIGTTRFPLDAVVKLAEYYNVSLDYLAGRSPLIKNKPLTDEEKALVESWRQLSERNKGKIEYHIFELLKLQKQQYEAISQAKESDRKK